MYKEIDLASSFKKVAEGSTDDVELLIEDEEGNDITPKKVDVVAEKKEDQIDEKSIVVKEDEDGAEEVKKQEKKPQQVFKSKAQDRIRELIKKKKESEATLTAKIEALERQLSATNRESLVSRKQSLDARINDTKKALERSHEEGKYAEVADYTTTLSGLQTEKLVVESAVEKVEYEEKNKPSKSTQQNQEEEFDDTQMLAWMGRNRDWWQKDSVKTTLAVRLSKKIDKEGILTPDDPEYWTEVDERLTELLGQDQEKTIESKPSNKEEVKTKNKPPQTASNAGGASRNSSITKTKDGRVTVRMEPHEREWAKKLGLTEAEWVREKYRSETSKDEHGYQEIFPKN